MKCTFSLSVGALIRKAAIFELQKAAQVRGLSFSSIDDGGWLSTEYSITIEGPDDMVRDYLQKAEEWARRALTE
jgi:hypothetical protein